MLLPVGPLAVPAAVVDEAASGAARRFRIGPLAVGAGAVVVAGGGLFLHRHGFGRFRQGSLLKKTSVGSPGFGRGAFESLAALGNPATPAPIFFWERAKKIQNQPFCSGIKKRRL